MGNGKFAKKNGIQSNRLTWIIAAILLIAVVVGAVIGIIGSDSRTVAPTEPTETTEHITVPATESSEIDTEPTEPAESTEAVTEPVTQPPEETTAPTSPTVAPTVPQPTTPPKTVISATRIVVRVPRRKYW